MNTALAIVHIKANEKGIARETGAIDPCSLCAHGAYREVDSRCTECELRGRRFFEVLHAGKLAK